MNTVVPTDVNLPSKRSARSMKLRDINASMEAVINQHDERVPQRLRREVGLIRLSGSADLLRDYENKISKNDHYLWGVIFLICSSVFIPIIGYCVNWPFIESIVAKVMIVLISLMMGFLFSIPIIAFLESRIKSCTPNYDLLNGCKHGWHDRFLRSCQSLAGLGTDLPHALTSLIPALGTGNPSLKVLQQLGDEDTAHMFVLTETLEAQLLAAKRDKANLQAIPSLALKGETGELLSRVASALEVDDTSQPRPVLI